MGTLPNSEAVGVAAVRELQAQRTVHGAVARELKAYRAEGKAIGKKADIFQNCGYKVVEGPAAEASQKQFAERFSQEFPQVKGEKPTNPDEINSRLRAQIPIPECTPLEGPTGEKLWALSLGDRLTVVIDAQATTRPTVEHEDVLGTVYPLKNFLVGHIKGGDQMVDVLAYLRNYEKRWGRLPADVFMALEYMDPYFAPGSESKSSMILMPFSLRRNGQKVAIDPDETTNTLIHEGAHAARQVVDQRIIISEWLEEAAKKGILAAKIAELLKVIQQERGAHAVGWLVARGLRNFIDLRSYVRSMRRSLETYDLDFAAERSKIGRAAFALSRNRIAADKRKKHPTTSI